MKRTTRKPGCHQPINFARGGVRRKMVDGHKSATICLNIITEIWYKLDTNYQAHQSILCLTNGTKNFESAVFEMLKAFWWWNNGLICSTHFLVEIKPAYNSLLTFGSLKPAFWSKKGLSAFLVIDNLQIICKKKSLLAYYSVLQPKEMSCLF